MSKILTPLTYEELLNEIEAFIKRFYPNYERLESDSFSVLIEAFAYKIALLEQRRVNSIKSLLLTYAQGQDLDNFCQNQGIERLDGAYPYANYSFSIKAPFKQDVVLPKGLELGDESGEHRAFLKNSLTLKAGELSVGGVVEYFKKQKFAKIKCENLLTPLTFSLQVKAQGSFADGGEVESDEAFRERYLLSLHSHTTAGSQKAYIFHAKSADSRIDDVAVFTSEHSPGIVEVIIHSDEGVDDLMLQRVREVLNSDNVRPLTDKVLVRGAENKVINIEADIFLFDLKDAANIAASYETLFKKRKFKIGEDLPLSEIIKNLHVGGVYKVVLKNPREDVLADKENIKIQELALSYKEYSSLGVQVLEDEL